MIKNSWSGSISYYSSRLIFLVRFILILFFISSLQGCGGSGGGGGDTPASPKNVGGGYTLLASGGILNDGSGIKGFTVLATLRDAQGWGPTTPWTITITGPGSTSTLSVQYSDPRLGSYMCWEWASSDYPSGTYRATATNGTVSIYYDFTVNASNVLPRPAPNASYAGNDMTVTWPAVSGAKSYSYEVCSPDAVCVSGLTVSQSALVTFATLTAGDYSIHVEAYATDLIALFANHTASPSLASQENISVYEFTYPVGNTVDPSNFALSAAGGVLDYGATGSGGPIYGLAIWTSLQDISTNPSPTAPAGDWNIKVTDPHGVTMNYIYPAGSEHYAYWYYGIEPVVGTYTVVASYGTASITSVFSFSNTSPQLAPLSYSQISGVLVPNTGNSSINDVSISWPSVSGANSYYVSLWADVWNAGTSQYDYQEVWSTWVNTTSMRVTNGSVNHGLQCDVYVTAYQVDMTAATPPATMPLRADMSENYYGYPLPFTAP